MHLPVSLVYDPLTLIYRFANASKHSCCTNKCYTQMMMMRQRRVERQAVSWGISRILYLLSSDVKVTCFFNSDSNKIHCIRYEASEREGVWGTMPYFQVSTKKDRLHIAGRTRIKLLGRSDLVSGVPIVTFLGQLIPCFSWDVETGKKMYIPYAPHMIRQVNKHM